MSAVGLFTPPESLREGQQNEKGVKSGSRTEKRLPSTWSQDKSLLRIFVPDCAEANILLQKVLQLRPLKHFKQGLALPESVSSLRQIQICERHISPMLSKACGKKVFCGCG